MSYHEEKGIELFDRLGYSQVLSTHLGESSIESGRIAISTFLECRTDSKILMGGTWLREKKLAGQNMPSSYLSPGEGVKQLDMR
jgi:hypothetical protein